MKQNKRWKKINTSKVKVMLLGIIFAFIILVLFMSVFTVSVAKMHLLSETDLKPYVETSNLVTKIVKSERGTIYDRNSIPVAQDTIAYDIICYLSPERKNADGTPAHVVNAAETANILSKYLGANEMDLYKFLTISDGRTQTEIGTKGRSISEEVKNAIEAENLPGVEFVKTLARKYPHNTFSSYTIGFAQTDEEGNLVGKMGAELYYNDYLQGKDGYQSYQVDKNGFILNGMKNESIPAKNGNHMYLTIDKGLQDALQASFKKTTETFNTYRAWGVVMNVNTGEILAMGQTPSFDLNVKNITDYTNFISQFPYEAGSTMKAFTYAAAMESGNYNPNQWVNSDAFCYAANKKTPYRVSCSSGKAIGSIHNAAKKGWGNILVGDGMKYSSNVITSHLVTNVMSPEFFLQKLKDFGFFNKTYIDGFGEVNGVLNFEWPSEKLALSYGQGSTVTTLQLIQAYSAIMREDGQMIKPYYVDKFIDPYTQEIVYENQPTIAGSPISPETAKAVRDLMYDAANSDDGTARHYRIDQIPIIAKTGTSQVAINGRYDSNRTISSVAIGLPAENPKYFVYYAFEADYDYNAHYKTEHITSLLESIVELESINAEYELFLEHNVDEDAEAILMPDLTGHAVDYAKTKVEGFETVIVGDGDQVIKQFPVVDNELYQGDKVFLLTEYDKLCALDFTGWSRHDMLAFAYLTNTGLSLSGYGYVNNQSISPGNILNKDDILYVTLLEQKGGDVNEGKE